ncbi:MAG: peptidase [Actinobacteria bacterium]|nr:MAG: peptidase [Actinomycetota bacterium]
MLAVFDGHNDALIRDDHARIGTGRSGGHVDVPRMRAGGMRGGIFAVFTPSSRMRKKPLRRRGGVLEFKPASPVDHRRAAAHATAAAGRLLAMDRAGRMRVALDIAAVDAAKDDDRTPVAVLHLEGAEAIDSELEALDTWYAAGLRSLGPVWSRPNAFAHGVPLRFPSSPDTGPGLTAAGRELVERCAELGILVDLSHLNEAGFWDVARLDVGPLVASHSGAHTLAASSRNLTDAQLDAIGASGGLVGIVFACALLRADFADDPDTPLQLIVDHARYVAERIGVEHVALGSDFDGATVPAELGDASGLPRLVAALAIAWENWRRVLATWWS